MRSGVKGIDAVLAVSVALVGCLYKSEECDDLRICELKSQLLLLSSVVDIIL